jgi:RNA polymerase primary sigma factor
MLDGTGGDEDETREVEASPGAAGRLPPLTRAAEHAIALRASQGDVGAAQSLVLHNLGLVGFVVRRLRRGPVPLEDLVQEGHLGLLQAVAKFDPHAGTRFATYAVWWIRAFVGRGLRESRSAVRPRRGTSAPPDLSLDAPAGVGGSDGTHLELLEDGSEGAEGRFLAAERDAEVRRALAAVRGRLGELGWSLVHDRLQQDAPLTLAQVGARWGVSRERARQVEVETRRLLRRYFGEVGISDVATASTASIGGAVPITTRVGRPAGSHSASRSVQLRTRQPLAGSTVTNRSSTG